MASFYVNISSVINECMLCIFVLLVKDSINIMYLIFIILYIKVTMYIINHECTSISVLCVNTWYVDVLAFSLFNVHNT